MDCAHEVYRPRLSLDGSDLLLSGGGVGDFVLLPDATVADRNLRHPQMGRILHPFFGVLIFVVLMFMFVRFVHHNIPDKQDIPWVKGIVEVLKGNEHKVAKVGKYNAGQKMMFWTIMSMIFVLLVTGVIIWRPYFAHYFPIQVIRYALLIHATSAIILIHAILIHMYMAFWVKGSIKGMIEGKVTRRWAQKHHPRWYRDVERLEAKKESTEGIK